MQTAVPSRFIWRVIALIAVVVNIFLNYWLNAYPLNGLNNGAVSDKYPTLFTPAGYAFSIWGLIYLSVLIYAVFQLLPAQRKRAIYDRLAIPLIVINLLSMAWLVAFSYERMLLSVVIIVGMLVSALILLVRSQLWVSEMGGSSWISVPFSLYAGWLSVAVIANTAVWLTAAGWQGGGIAAEIWASTMIFVAVAAGIFVSWQLRDVVYPLVIGWACVAIWAARQGNAPAVATSGLIAAILLVVWSGVYGWRIYQHRSHQTSWG